MKNIKELENKMIIEKMGGHRTFYKFIEKNKLGETLTVEISETFVDNSLKSDTLPKLWKKHRFTNKLYNSYLNVDCYVTDKDGTCWGKYNPTEKLSDDKKRNVINFDYLLEVSEENKQYLLDLIYKMFMANANEIISKEEYNKLCKDYKTTINSQHYILKGTEDGTCLVPVIVE